MRKSRSQIFRAEDGLDSFTALIERNTYGGTGKGKHEKQQATRRQMPVVTSEAGIKMEWDHAQDEYPSTVKLKMTDGKWATYKLS